MTTQGGESSPNAAWGPHWDAEGTLGNQWGYDKNRQGCLWGKDQAQGWWGEDQAPGLQGGGPETDRCWILPLIPGAGAGA